MCHATPDAETRRGRLFDLLLGHLRDAGVPVWPGSDGLTIGDVVHDYPQVAAAGRVPTRQQLLDTHPDLNAELIAFFAARAWVGAGRRCDVGCPAGCFGTSPVSGNPERCDNGDPAKRHATGGAFRD